LDENISYEIRIDDQFYKDNEKEISNRVKSLKLSFEIKFIKIEKELGFKTFEIDQKVLEKINIKSKENIEKNIIEEKTEKSYRRKIKKKTVEDTN
jgi:hypothetical protein